MKLLYMNEKSYKKLLEKAGCYLCKNHQEIVVSDSNIAIPDGICADCCCSKIFMEHFEWDDKVKVFDL